jgi:hypothetical protein
MPAPRGAEIRRGLPSPLRICRAWEKRVTGRGRLVGECRERLAAVSSAYSASETGPISTPSRYTRYSSVAPESSVDGDHEKLDRATRHDRFHVRDARWVVSTRAVIQ